MNGAAKALDLSYQFVELAEHFENEQGVHAVLLAGHIEARSYMSATLTIVGGEPVEPPTPPAQAWIAAATTDDSVAHALRLLGSVADLD